MADLFNDPNSTLKVLIMLYDVNSIGLNLHKACNRVVIASLPRSRGQESQLEGRAFRITSEFPLTVVRRFTPKSHDQFRSVKQAEKAVLQLAANFNDPHVKDLVVKLLNEFQGEVQKCHADPALDGLRKAMEDGKTIEYFQRKAGVTPHTHMESPLKEQTSMLSDPQTKATPVADTKAPRDSLDQQTEITLDGRQLRDRIQLPGAQEANDDSLFVSELSDSDSDDSRSLDEDDPEYSDVYSDSESESEDEECENGEADSDDDGNGESMHDATEFEMSLSECQPDDLTCHHQDILKFGPGKTWEREDLDHDEHLRLGLRLLYNKINNTRLPHLTRSIHILYKLFSQPMIDQMSKVRDPNSRKKEKSKGESFVDRRDIPLLARDFCTYSHCI
ncbi:hypothetical protein BDW74DRAFT_23703 [Aspergillus multicolor]|uniref:uncharacterized protein n=1 Tax=Aspergillus multicolor TaxID=41759 RepID=UPI003CCE334F